MAESRSEPSRQTPAPRSKRPKRKIPDATVARLPLYLRSLVDIADGGATTVSSERLAELSGVNAAKVRKDLSYLGSYGTRGVGYDVEFLLFQMSRELGLTSDWPVVIVGLGNLGHALANYGGFGDRGFPVAALVDVDERVVGTTINGITVRHLDDLPEIAREDNIAIGIIATPAHAAQQVADRLAAAGVTSVLNFAPTVLSVPEEVSIRKVDLAVELQILSFYQRRKLGDVADVVSSEMAGAVTGDGDTLNPPSTDQTEDQPAPGSTEPRRGDGTFGDGDRAGLYRTPD
jgi:redox-sensing transcriptional repressor